MWTLAEPLNDYLVGEEVALAQLRKEGHRPSLYYMDYDKPLTFEEVETLELTFSESQWQVVLDYRELTGRLCVEAVERYCGKTLEPTIQSWSNFLLPDYPEWVKIDWKESIKNLEKLYMVSRNGRIYTRSFKDNIG